MANPLLNDKAFAHATDRSPDQAGWAAPRSGGATTWNPPITDGPVSPWTGTERMTANGAMSATLMLSVLLLAGATVGWMQVKELDGQVASFPGWVIGAMIVGLISAV
ncbi:MAG: hypothetical protein EBZ54_05860, partial [Actinobacteria bacterium]|nr:hypothetical protein [Actinomycetota bacterium]